MEKGKFNREHLFVIGFFLLIVACAISNELLLGVHLMLIAFVANILIKKGWPGYFKGTSLLMLAAGIPFFLIHAVIGYFMLSEEVEHAMRGRDILDANRAAYEKSVEDFVSHLENDTVQISVQDLDRGQGLGIVSQEIKSYYFKWATAFMPNEIGSEPIMAMRSILDASKAVVMIDIQGFFELSAEKDRLISEKLDIPVDELSFEDRLSVSPFEAPGATHVSHYSCLIDEDGNLLHLSSLNSKLLYLDLTDDPVFEKIGKICEAKAREGKSSTDFEAIRERAREAVGLPPVSFED